MKKLFFGILLSAGLLYYSLRNIVYEELWRSIENKDLLLALPAIFIFFIISMLRSLRLNVLLFPTQKKSQCTLYLTHCVGTMFSILIPMRLGELFRSYLLSHKMDVSFGTTLSVIVIERLLDLLSVLGIFICLLSVNALPAWLLRPGLIMAATVVVAFVLLIALSCKPELSAKLLGPCIAKLPARFHVPAQNFSQELLGSARVLANRSVLLSALVLSLVIWSLGGVAVYSLFLFFELNLPLAAAFNVLMLTVIGISLPTAPAYLGNFQFACLSALLLYGIPKEQGLGFALGYYVIGVGLYVLLGLVCLPLLRISWQDIMAGLKNLRGTKA